MHTLGTRAKLIKKEIRLDWKPLRKKGEIPFPRESQSGRREAEAPTLWENQETC
jgi:hypothetical protein